ncbi:MAG: histidinol phosphatase [Methanoculleus sp. SDB]|nr:MAG: histidinol phosphatase [Methanoculleus sp. SDB]
MESNADLHIHSPYSMAVSPRMTPLAILETCAIKGITTIATGDALHPEWQKRWADFLENEQGITVVPSAEIEGAARVHHLILSEDFAVCENIASRLSPFSKNIGTGGRPQIRLSGVEIARAVHEEGGFIGPAHAFTPWTGIYAHYNSMPACYGSERPDFLELGLSADSSYGAGIHELCDVPFLSNSDAHSPSPLKIGREFNRIRIRKAGARETIESIRRGDILMNAGFFPEEGKYNRTACTRCFQQYSAAVAESNGWRCPQDGGRIKKGVRDRALELSDTAPSRRPPYLHIIPLGEIIRTCLGMGSPETRKCQQLYCALIDQLGNEISILIDVPVSDIAGIDGRVAAAIAAFRSGEITLVPGGGGKYGSFSF